MSKVALQLAVKYVRRFIVTMFYFGRDRSIGFKPDQIFVVACDEHSDPSWRALWGDNCRRLAAPRDVTMGIARETALALSIIFAHSLFK